MNLDGKKTLCLITGASTTCGLGCAKYFLDKAGKGSKMILTSRNMERLNKAVSDTIPKDKQSMVVPLQFDLQNLTSKQVKEDLTKSIGDEQFEVAIIIHNAFATNDLSKKVNDPQEDAELDKFIAINFKSLVIINAYFWQLAKADSKSCIHMSAGSATKPCPSLGLVGGIRAGRRMLLNVMHVEDPTIKVMHYNPGLVDSEGLRAIRDESHSDFMRNWAGSPYKNDELMLTPHEVAERLYYVMCKDEYTSGDYVNGPDIVVGK